MRKGLCGFSLLIPSRRWFDDEVRGTMKDMFGDLLQIFALVANPYHVYN